MTYDEIAEMMGVSTATVEGNWGGGPWSYLLESAPHARVCGFKTREAAILHVVESRFGRDEMGKKVLSLLLRTPKHQL